MLASELALVSVPVLVGELPPDQHVGDDAELSLPDELSGVESSDEMDARLTVLDRVAMRVGGVAVRCTSAGAGVDAVDDGIEHGLECAGGK